MAAMKTLNQKKKMRNVNNVAYLMVLPFVIIFLIFNVYPVLRTLQISFTDYKGYGDMNWVAFKNYGRVFGDKYFWISLWNTIKIWVPNIILQLGLAFLLTIVFSDMKYRVKGLPVFRAVYYLPNIIASTSIAFLFQTLLDWRYGSINIALRQMSIVKGMPINWLGDPKIAPFVISVISAWQWFGNSFIMLMAGVQGINKDYFEAASIDGAGRWTTFAKITMPLLKPIMLYVSITSFIGGLQMFDMPFLMGTVNGNPYGSTQTMIMYLYKFGFATRPKQVGYASAIAYVIFFLILIVSLIQFKVMGRED
jgi:multiple sugar transport system permease protein